MKRARQDAGETLVEVLLTVVIVGLTFTALISSLGMAGNAGNSQRDSVQADVVMRNYAEAAKAVFRSCVPGKLYPPIRYPADLLPLPEGFAVSMTVDGTPGVGGVVALGTCPPVADTQVLILRITHPLGAPVIMRIRVRTP
ncbi:MAG: type II secretion system protein [Ilumatobacteraceae bacterium]